MSQAPIPEEIRELLKVRVNHDGEDRATGMWIASVSVYKALHVLLDHIATITQQLSEAQAAARRLSEREPTDSDAAQTEKART